MSYWRLKAVAWDAFTSRPLTGIGLDRFHVITEAAFQEGRLTEPYRAIDPHSTLPGRLAEAGLIGAATLIIFWIVIALESRRLLSQDHRHAWMATAAVAALPGTLINTMNADVMNFRFGWVVFGLVRGLPPKRLSEAGSSRNRNGPLISERRAAHPPAPGASSQAARPALNMLAVPRHQHHQPPQLPPIRAAAGEVIRDDTQRSPAR